MASGFWRENELESDLDTAPVLRPFDEDIGGLIRDSNDQLYLFSSDYPHPEGGRHPLGRFGRSLEGASPETLDRFYSENFAELFQL